MPAPETPKTPAPEDAEAKRPGQGADALEKAQEEAAEEREEEGGYQ